MNRSAKRHRSTKVPNVKLRPAPAGPSERNKKLRQEAEAEKEDLAHHKRLREAHRKGKTTIDNYDDSDDDDDDDDCGNNEDDDKGPLLGCVICMTGISEERNKLTEYALMLGAQVEGNLTEDATHLIANAPGSDKYRCALKLGLPILRPDWIRELRARWTEADQYDFDGLMEEHRLDTFENLCVALAGITEPSERTELRRELKSGSAKTPTTFALDGSFTHLICGDIKDSKTMEVVAKFRRKAERFLRRGESLPGEGEVNSTEMKAATDLRVVWKEWVEDSLEVRGSIDEELYAIEGPKLTVAQRNELKESIFHERKQREKLNREKMAAARRLKDTKDENRGRKEVSETPNRTGEVQRVTKKPKVDINAFLQNIAEVDAPEQDTAKSTSNGSNGSKSGLSKTRVYLDGTGQVTSSSKVSSTPPLLDSKDTGKKSVNESMEVDDDDDDDMLLEADPNSGLHSHLKERSLTSLTFRIDLRNEDHNQAARKALERVGVLSILDADDPNPANFHILPLGKVSSLLLSHLGTPVTHLFIERCLYESRVVSLDESFALQPSAVTFPLEGVEDVLVGVTGFSGDEEIDRKQLDTALRAAGIALSSTLKRGLHTHLLMGKEAERSESSRMKIQRAKEWGIHCVGLEFVDKIYKYGKVEPAISKVNRMQALQSSRSESIGASMGTCLGETQNRNTSSIESKQNELRPLGVNEQVSNAAMSISRPWQRSTSGSQALLDGEESRGVSFRAPHSRFCNAESLEGGTMAINTTSDAVMGFLSSRHQQGGMTSKNTASSTTNIRKRGRQPPSRFRDGRANSAALERTSSENPSVEELLAMRQAEEERQMMSGPTQATQSSNLFVGKEDESMRITYDDPSSRRERRKISDLVATSVLKRLDEEERIRSSSKETEEDIIDMRTSSESPSKGRRTTSLKNPFVPSIQARRQPGTCDRSN